MKALIIEDEAMVAMLLEDMLTELGHEVAVIAGRMDDAAKAVRESDVDFAVIDVNLNGERTYALAETLVERGVPFMFSTGYGPEGIEPRWRDCVLLQKPFELRDIASAIERACGDRQP